MSVMRIAHIRAAPGANAMYIAAFDCCRPPEPLSLRVAYALKSRDTFAQGRVHETRETGSANDDSNQLKFPSAVNPATRAVLLQGEEVFPYKMENSLWLFLTRSSFARVFPESQPRFDSIRLLVPCPSRPSPTCLFYLTESARSVYDSRLMLAVFRFLRVLRSPAGQS